MAAGPALFGDAEAAVVDILLNDADLLAAFPAVNVSTDLVGYQESLQWVEVARKGGNITAWQAVEKARIDFYIYAPVRSQAADIGQLVMRAVFAAMGSYVGKGCRLQGGVIETGLTRTPDRATAGARYVMSFRLTFTPENN